MFMPDKPHRYGTKMFMVCDSRTAYCHRFEVNVGAREKRDDTTVDNKTGAAAVVRNMRILLGENSRGFHLIVIDRFYSSVALALQLLSMSIYVFETIVINRIGYDAQVVEKCKSRPRRIPQGSFTFTRCVAVPTMVACHWWDRKPVHYLATGVSMAKDRLNRNVRQTLHTHKQFDDWVTVSGVQKRRQRSCKVCALLRGDRNKSYHTTFFCEDCSHGEAKCFLYPKARREYNGKRVVLQRPGKVGRRKKTRRELLQDGGAADDEEDD
ncbi:hypothetical protein PC110_g10936 [Phytophthora cactorum]|uniref:PiggyBac transposable element-derived protein domain-containing protein n=1 Tax=Phytophthora cactorum TaxID=29920 RepID=A0A329S7L5_9STRA|nr:hypothetical protein PC110_g10936 [Phytophthora cactorum]